MGKKLHFGISLDDLYLDYSSLNVGIRPSEVFAAIYGEWQEEWEEFVKQKSSHSRLPMSEQYDMDNALYKRLDDGTLLEEG